MQYSPELERWNKPIVTPVDERRLKYRVVHPELAQLGEMKYAQLQIHYYNLP